MIEINGGVTAPIGYKASGVSCGIKKEGKDLALVTTEKTAVAAGVYTKNIVKGHSLQLTMKNMKDGFANAVLINSGCANACVGERGYHDALNIAQYCADKLNCDVQKIIFGSTGVIGVPLNTEMIKSGIDSCIASLSQERGYDAANAIMTTDTISKEAAVEVIINKKHVKIGGMAKGSGMIHPNMATMICIITTDANISREVLEPVFKRVMNKTFNRISVDGDTSVCDMAIILANGMVGNDLLTEGSEDLCKFEEALLFICEKLSKMIARDGEGATKLIEIVVEGAKTQKDAYDIAAAIAKSPLVKTAIFGEDANWGRIITAAGYSGVEFEPDGVDIYIGDILTCWREQLSHLMKRQLRKCLKMR